ncbi:MAG: hypothetical protein WBN78_12185 [Gammaproteobacteria bacterium]
MIGPILPFLASIRGWVDSRIHGLCARREDSQGRLKGISGVNRLFSRLMLNPGPRDDICAVIDRLDENADRNRKRIAEQWAEIRAGERPPPSLLYRPAILATIDPEILGVLLSFADPDDLDRVFGVLAELRDDPAALDATATGIASCYLERGLEHAGRPVAHCPLKGGWFDSGPGQAVRSEGA